MLPPALSPLAPPSHARALNHHAFFSRNENEERHLVILRLAYLCAKIKTDKKYIRINILFSLSHCLCADSSLPRFGMLDNSVAERVESLAKMPHLAALRTR